MENPTSSWEEYERHEKALNEEYERHEKRVDELMAKVENDELPEEETRALLTKVLKEQLEVVKALQARAIALNKKLGK